MSELETISTFGRYPEPDGPWNVQFHWGVIDGAATCVGITVWGNVAPLDHNRVRELPGGARAVTSSTLHGMAVGGLAARSRAGLTTWLTAWYRERDLDQLTPEQQKVAAAWTDSHRMRRGGWPADHLPQVAAFYAARVREGDPAPTKAVHKHWNVSHSAAAKWIARCRAAGLLDKTEKGRAGGIPAPKKQTKRGGKR